MKWILLCLLTGPSLWAQLHDCPRPIQASVPRAPQATPPKPATYSKQAAVAVNFIDEILFRAQDQDGIARAALADDLTFLRRVTLDLVGRQPHLDRILAFIEDPDPDKRSKYVDELLESQDFIWRWAYWLGDLTQNTAAVSKVQGASRLALRLEEAVTQNMPLDDLVARLISAEGNTYSDGWPSFILRAGGLGAPTLQDRLDNEISSISAAFLGIDTNCISCHDGGGYLEDINLYLSRQKREDLWRFAAFLSQKDIKAANNDVETYGFDFVHKPTQEYYASTEGGTRPPRSGGRMAPKYLFTGEEPNGEAQRNQELARIIVNDFQFARNMANRFWGHFFSVGLVEPYSGFDPARLDPSNPPGGNWEIQPLNPELLDALAQHLIDVDFDMRVFFRTLLNSSSYQLSADYPGTWQPDMRRYFAKREVRYLTGEEIVDSLINTIVHPTYGSRYLVGLVDFDGDDYPRRGEFRYAYSVHQMAYTIDAAMLPPFDRWLRTFGVGDRYNLLSSNQPTPTQALLMMNDQLINEATHPHYLDRYNPNNGTFYRNNMSNIIADKSVPVQERIRKLFLLVLAREPSARDLDYAARLIGKQRLERGAPNLMWALLNHDEFRLNY